MHVAGIFCDFAKAFDCIKHEICLAKSYFCGIRGVSDDWLRSYLTHKRQRVKVKTPNITKIFL
jgi:hypothetical protein